MTRRIFTAIASSALIATVAFAQTETSFPFEGEIVGDDVNVRSGEGTRYYATNQLKEGDRVVVVGISTGWYQIMPPAGSFSYIDKTAVDRHTSGIGTVSRDKAYVRAGSHVSRRKSRTQLIVEKGEPVVILGEVDGFYMIEPPKRVTLYISPQFVKRVAAGQESAVMRQYNSADWKTTDTSAEEAIEDPAVSSEVAVSEVPEKSPAPRKTFVSAAENKPINQPPIIVNEPTAESVQPHVVPNQPVHVESKPSSSARGDVLVLGPNSGNSDAKTTSVSYETSHDDNATKSTHELAPADRRPPARIPEWAGDDYRGSESTINDPFVINHSESSTTTVATRNEPIIVSEPGFSSSRGTVGTMTEINATDANTPVAANSPTNDAQPTFVDSTSNHQNSSGDNIVTNHSENTIVPYNRSASGNTLTITATDSSSPTTNPPTTNETIRTTSITTESSYATANNPPIAVNESFNTSTVEHSTAVMIPPAATPPPDVPVDPNSGPYAAKLVAVEGDLHAVMSMPVEQRPYDQLIQRYEEIAIQTGEYVPAEYARIRVGQLQNLERIRRLAVRYASDQQGIQTFSRRMDEERQEIRRTNQQAPVGGAFDYEGELLKSYAFAPELRRYRLVDPGTKSTIIYVDIPNAVATNPDTLTGHRVGVRIGSRQYSDAAQIPIVEAATIVDLTSPPTKYDAIPAEPGRNSLGVLNHRNTPASDPNSSIDSPDRREPAELGTMRELTAIAS